MLTQYQIENIIVPNRIVMPPMCQYSATHEGLATDWHFIHYGSRAVGGVGLIMVEATAVEKRGRLSGRDLGVWHEDQIDGLKKIVESCKQGNSVVGIQLAHAGRKAWGDELVAPSALAYPEKLVPRSLSLSEIDGIIKKWQIGARRAREAGFDLIQIHGAHGYLIHEFLSPLSNHRTDRYGGSFENRLRLLLEIITAVQKEWPKNKPLSVRLSASDYLPGGINLEETIAICQVLKEKGVHLLDISSGGLLPATIKATPGYQIPFAEAVKKQLNIPTITVGLITDPSMVQEIISNERADFVALGRELLRNPYWVLENSKNIKPWPRQYERAALPTHS